MAKNKKIFIEYLEIDSIPYENNRVRIAHTPPKYIDYKELYLYELFYYDFLEEKIKNMLSENFRDYQFFDSFIVTLTQDEFNQIKPLFKEQSDLEKSKSSDELNRMLLFLNTSVKIAQKDPKMWEI